MHVWLPKIHALDVHAILHAWILHVHCVHTVCTQCTCKCTSTFSLNFQTRIVPSQLDEAWKTKQNNRKKKHINISIIPSTCTVKKSFYTIPSVAPLMHLASSSVDTVLSYTVHVHVSPLKVLTLRCGLMSVIKVLLILQQLLVTNISWVHVHVHALYIHVHVHVGIHARWM